MSESEPKHERERVVEHCLVFDVDGVLTDPQQKEVTQLEGLVAIAKRLKNNEPVILNTGRSVDFVKEKIISKLEPLLENRGQLHYVFASGEKGAVVLYYNDAGEEQIVVDESISVPAEVQQKAREIVEHQFNDSMFFDPTKKTMISIEMHDGYDLSAYQERQKELIPLLNSLLDSPDLKKSFAVDPTTIATDIQSRDVGKAFGVRKALWWLQEKNIAPKEFLTFGDSQSDLPMYEELVRNGKPTRFIFVGEPDKLTVPKDVPVVQTKDRYEKGVTEFLKTL